MVSYPLKDLWYPDSILKDIYLIIIYTNFKVEAGRSVVAILCFTEFCEPD